MNRFLGILLCKLQSGYKRVNNIPSSQHLNREENPDKVSEIIYEELSNPRPSMITRFGNTEFQCLINYLGIQNGYVNYYKFIKNEIPAWWWRKDRMENMRDLSGFFPPTEKELNKFCQLMLEDIKYIDILGSWINNESDIKELLPNTKNVFLPYMEPYWSTNPWSRILKEKKILVIHPFKELIQEQYYNHHKQLFTNPNILPEFNLKTIKAVQTLGGSSSEKYKSWFDALYYMEDQISKEDFDITIIGCGAYGLPLAAFVKRMGKKAIYLGGATQLLFGIKGKRWEDPYYGVTEWNLPYNYYPQLFNQYWTKPKESDKPSNANQVEGACYW